MTFRSYKHAVLNREAEACQYDAGMSMSVATYITEKLHPLLFAAFPNPSPIFSVSKLPLNTSPIALAFPLVLGGNAYSICLKHTNFINISLTVLLNVPHTSTAVLIFMILKNMYFTYKFDMLSQEIFKHSNLEVFLIVNK